jgi:hypothetical protein
MIVDSENPPLIPWLFAPGRLPGATVFDYRFCFRPTISECPSIAWIDQNLINAVACGEPPDNLAPRRCRLNLGEGELLIAVPQGDLTSAAKFAKLLQHPGDGLLHLKVRTLFDPVVIRAHKTYGHFPHAVAPMDFVFEGLTRPLPHQAQLIFGHRAFHPQHQAIVELAGIVDAIGIDS